MNTRIASHATIRLASACALALLSAAPSAVRAASLTWDSGGVGAHDGSSPAAPVSAAGTWNTTNSNWSNGTVDSIWNNANKDTAVFGGTANYAVTVQTGGVTVGGIEFTNSGSTLVTLQTGPVTLAEASTGAGVLIKQTAGGSGASAAINSALSGSTNVTFTVVNLILNSASNTYTGSTTITAGGNLRLGVNNALPTGTDLTISGGSLMFPGATSQTVNSLTGASGAKIWGRGTASSLKIAGSSATTYAGTIVNDSGKVHSMEIAGSGQLTLTNTTGLTYNGTTTVSGTGTLKLGAGANLTNTSSVIISGGTLTSTSGNINLGAGAVSMSAGHITPAGVGTAGTFTLAANQAFSTTGGTLDFDVGTAFDQIIGSGSGTFSIGSGTTLALTPGTGFSYANTYTLFSSFSGGSVAGSGFAISGYDTANYTAALSNAGVLSFAAIPEPSSFAALAGAALLGFAALRRRVRR